MYNLSHNFHLGMILSLWAQISLALWNTKLNLYQVGVKYSAEMEVFALKSILNFLKGCGIIISVLVTDRSTTVRAMLAKDFPEINHQHDIWFLNKLYTICILDERLILRHFVKGIKNRIYKASKLVRYAILKDWMSSVVNMLWWSLATAKGKNCSNGHRSRLWFCRGFVRIVC